MRTDLLAACLFFFVWLLPGVRTAAAFEVRPAILDLVVHAGSSTDQVIFVKNTDASPLKVFFKVQKFLADKDGRPRFLDPGDVAGAPEWIRVSAQEKSLVPGEEAALQVRIAVPEDAPAGGRYVALFTTEAAQSGTSVGVSRRIATLLMLAVDPERAPAHPVLADAEIGMKREGFPWGLVRAENEWSAHIGNVGKTHGTIVAEAERTSYGLFGSDTQAYSKVVRLLPDEERSWSFAWKNVSPIEYVRVAVKIDGVITRTDRKILVLPSGWGVIVLLAIAVAAAVRFFFRRSVARRV